MATSLKKLAWITASIAVFLVVLVAGLLYIAFATPGNLRAGETRFILPNVTVITPRIERSSARDLTIANGRIERIDPAALPAAPAVLKEYSGMYVLPGLFDMHMHFPPGNILKLTEQSFLLYLVHGITAVRELGDGTATADPAAREALARGAPGPEMFTCGPFVAGTRALRWPNTVVVNWPEDADAIVEKIQAAGNICIKAYEDLSPDKLRALREATAKRGMAMPGHVPYGLDYVAGDVPEVQHYFGVPKPTKLKRDHLIERAYDWSSVDDARLDEVVHATLKNGTINLPTLVSTYQMLLYRDFNSARQTPSAQLLPRFYRDIVWDPRDGIAIWRGVDRRIADIEDSHQKKRNLTRRLFEAGAPLLIGTDTGQPFVTPGLAVHIEMREFAASGIPVEDVWAIATWKAADTLKRPDLGRVRAGATATLIVFREDPTKDLSALSTIAAVIVGGKLYRHADLERALGDWVRHFRNPLFDAISTRVARSTLDAVVLRDY